MTSSEHAAGLRRTPSAVDDLAERWLDRMVELSPELRIHLGREGDQAAYSDLSPDGARQGAAAAADLLRQAREAEPVDATDRVTQAELVRTLELQVEMHDAGFWQRDLNVIASPAQDLRDVFDLMPTESADDWDAVARRLAALPDAMRGYVESLRAGVRADNVPAARQVREVAAQAGRLADRNGFFGTLAERGSREVDALAGDLDRGAAAAGAAYADLVDVLTSEILPHAPTHDGVGRDHYALASRYFVGATIDLDETYAWGVDELARMVAEQERIAAEIVPGGSVADAIAALDADPAQQLHGTDALQAWMQETSDRAVDELGRTHFDIPEPMRRLECMIAPTQEGGIYYTPPSDDFSRPGRMWWSVPEGVTDFQPWRELTTVFHEGVPGHHLQLGLAVHHRDRLNAWRRQSWNSGHGEGWALYAERLMDELGHLTTPADRLGMLDGQRLRAARVVVDLGVHLGKERPDGSGTWTGDDVFPFLVQHASMSDEFLRFESNRYLGWPGQAPSYKVGQRLWKQLRDDWVAAHGDDLTTFHRDALAVGGVGMGTLRETLLG